VKKKGNVPSVPGFQVVFNVLSREVTMTSNNKSLNESLSQIRGRALTSVEFVLGDYVQLRFDGPTLTAYNWPTVTTSNRISSWGQDGYRDTLCERIGVRVLNTSLVEENDLAIYFEDGTVIRVPLREEDYRGIEAVYFVEEGGAFWVL
jgi:hypothetical protein